MVRHKTDDLTENSQPAPELHEKSLLFFSQDSPDVNRPSLIHFSSTPLFRLEQCPEKYVHLLKKKDHQHIGPIIKYFIGKSGHVVYLGGDAVINLYLRGRKKYRSLNILAILTGSDVDNYSSILNNIISSNDGVFSMGLKYRIRKNRNNGCFKDIALARYIIEPRLEGPEKLLYLLRSSPIELDLTTQLRFTQAFMPIEKS
jgi:hypothetical protein